MNIILCDDHSLMLDGLSSIINGFEDCKIVLKANTGMQVIEYLQFNPQPDIIITDVRMPNGINGFELVMYVSKYFPEVKVIACSGLYKEDVIIEMFMKGARGFISKECVGMDLRDALTEVYFGDLHFNDSFLSRASKIDKHKHRKNKIINNMTNHEIEIAKLMASGLAYKQIANKMGITPNSLENIRVRIFNKLGVATRIEVVIFLLEVGLL